jgi:type II secretory pathway pseudopilin PulG
MLIELLVAMALTLVVVTAVSFALQSTTRTQRRDQAYQQELQSAQVALARLIHDLRQATSFSLTSGGAPTPVQPGVLEFQMPVPGQPGSYYNVEYNCNALDTLGPPYTRCARTQALAPALPPPAGPTPGPLDIQHVWNNPTNTADLANGNDYAAFCTTTGSGPSGSVFFVQNPNYPDPNASPPPCDQTYELIVAQDPDYIQVRVAVPAGGDLQSGGLQHLIVLQDGTYLPNIDEGA